MTTSFMYAISPRVLRRRRASEKEEIMIGILTSLLSPILSPMGVSEADLNSYLTQLQGYV